MNTAAHVALCMCVMVSPDQGFLKHEQFTVVGFYPHGLIVSNGRHFNVLTQRLHPVL